MTLSGTGSRAAGTEIDGRGAGTASEPIGESGAVTGAATAAPERVDVTERTSDTATGTSITRQPARRRRSRIDSVWASRGLRLFSVVAAVLLWQLLTANDVRLWLRFDTLPTVTEIVSAFGRQLGTDVYYLDLGQSLIRILTGFAIATMLGVASGIALGRSRLFADVLGPLTELARPVPAIAVVPIAILLFPDDETGIVFITSLAAYFPIMVSTRHAVRALPTLWEDSVRTLGGGRWDVLVRVVFPGALPGIFGGLSVGIGVAWICLISAEMISGRLGVGCRTWQVLTEHTPDGFAGALVAALHDESASVRAAAAAGLRELVEVLPSADGLPQRLHSPDPVVRATVVDLLRALRAGTAAQFATALTDSDHRVRIEAVRALVSLDDGPAVAALAADPNREVRIAVAQGLATIGTGVEAIRGLAADRDPLVQAAALAGFAALGTDADTTAELVTALRHSAWQVRVGAARGLAGADPDVAVPALTEALSDPHLDVRKAAVLTLSTWADLEASRIALKQAVDDPDADVRAYARRALTG